MTSVTGSVHSSKDSAKLLDELSQKVARQQDELNKKDTQLKLQQEQLDAMMGRIRYFQQLSDNAISGGSRMSANDYDAYMRESARLLRRFLKMKFFHKFKPVFEGWKMFAPNNPNSFFSHVLPLLALPPDCDLRDYWYRVVVKVINKIMIQYRSDTTTAIRRQF